MSENSQPVGPDTLRLVRPPAGAEVREVLRWRLKGPRGGAELVLLPDEESPGGLTYPPGALGDAERLLARGKSGDARALAETLNDVEKRSIISRAHVMDGNLEPARVALGDGDDEGLALAKAALLLASGDVAAANAALKTATHLRPDGVSETYFSSLVEVAQGDLETAIGELSQVCASDPNHAVGRHQLGQLIMALGDPARAGTLYEQAMEIAPGFLPPALALAEMLVESRQFMEAMNLLASVLEDSPNALAPHLLRLRILLEVGQVDAAVSVSKTLKDAAPDHPEVVTLWAQALLLAERADEAHGEVLQRATGATGDARAKLFRVLSRLELSKQPPDVASGVAHLTEAIKHAPQPAELFLELAQVHLSTGAPTEASKVLEAMAGVPGADINVLLSAALTARNHGLYELAHKLGKTALTQVAGGPAEAQIQMFLDSLPS